MRTCDVICDSCNTRVAGISAIDAHVEGWVSIGKQDFCPDCEKTHKNKLTAMSVLRTMGLTPSGENVAKAMKMIEEFKGVSQ